MASRTTKPVLLYRLSRGGEFLYVRVPDETEGDAILKFNRICADLGFPDPAAIFSKRLGVSILPPHIRIRVDKKLETFDTLVEFAQYFKLQRITDRVWHQDRF